MIHRRVLIPLIPVLLSAQAVRSFSSAPPCLARMSAASSFSSTMPSEADICIVGCGISSLAAARRLICAGKIVVVLEAASRVGGRMRSFDAGDGQLLEFGAHWMHGIEGHPLYEYAVAEGIMQPLKKEEGSDEYENVPEGDLYSGIRLKAEGGRGIDLQLFGEANAKFSEIQETVEEGGPGQFTAGGETVAGVYRKLFSDYVSGSQWDDGDLWRVFDWCLRRVAAIDGAEIDEQSPDQLFEYKDLPGPQTLPVTGGYSKLFEHMLGKLPEETVWTSQPVRKIKWGGDGRAVVTTEGGHSVSAEHVIVTVSLGVLKKGDITFEPGLPKAKVDAIARMGIGQVEKAFFEFDEQQWDLLERLGFSKGMTVTLPPPSKDPSAAWTSRILGMNRTPGTQCMALWVTGAGACKDLHEKTPSQLIEALQELMKTFCAAGEDVPRAKSVVTTTWTADKLTLGAWSYLAAGSGKEDIATLAQPEGNLLFAGEATNKNYFGTVHGAFMTGEREADRVLGRLQQE